MSDGVDKRGTMQSIRLLVFVDRDLDPANTADDAELVASIPALLAPLVQRRTVRQRDASMALITISKWEAVRAVWTAPSDALRNSVSNRRFAATFFSSARTRWSHRCS